MKAIISAVLTGLFLLGCAHSETTEEKQARLESATWLDMCQLLIDEADYECRRLLPPLVVYEEMSDSLYGYYDGSDTIYINISLKGKDLFDVLMHEGIHYVHVQHGIIEIPGYAEPICWSENEAWMLTGIYFGEDNSNWWRWYPHCWQFYGNTQEVRDLGKVWNDIHELIEDWIWEN